MSKKSVDNYDIKEKEYKLITYQANKKTLEQCQWLVALASIVTVGLILYGGSIFLEQRNWFLLTTLVALGFVLYKVWNSLESYKNLLDATINQTKLSLNKNTDGKPRVSKRNLY